MQKGYFSGVRRNSQLSVDQGRSSDGFAFQPLEDDPERVRFFLPGTRPKNRAYVKLSENNEFSGRSYYKRDFVKRRTYLGYKKF